jgi:hypothetical protein
MKIYTNEYITLTHLYIILILSVLAKSFSDFIKMTSFCCYTKHAKLHDRDKWNAFVSFILVVCVHNIDHWYFMGQYDVQNMWANHKRYNPET